MIEGTDPPTSQDPCQYRDDDGGADGNGKVALPDRQRSRERHGGRDANAREPGPAIDHSVAEDALDAVYTSENRRGRHFIRIAWRAAGSSGSAHVLVGLEAARH